MTPPLIQKGSSGPDRYLEIIVYWILKDFSLDTIFKSSTQWEKGCETSSPFPFPFHFIPFRLRDFRMFNCVALLQSTVTLLAHNILV